MIFIASHYVTYRAKAQLNTCALKIILFKNNGNGGILTCTCIVDKPARYHYTTI
jgi:hypothetical protein